MSKPLTADDVLPIVAALTPQEKSRLLRLISTRGDANAYASMPPASDEFASDADPLAHDGEGWDDIK